MPTNRLEWWVKIKGIEYLLLGIGALAGAFLRYKIAESPILLGVLPINILIINVIGSFILGIFVAISMNFNLDPKYSILIAIGFCGSFTTMSSFALQSVSLIDSKHLVLFGLNLIGNAGLSILALILGRAVTLAIMRP
ncbi:MAG TPA: fluoride efflux transporter CrcB [Nitrososphaeraceae archaeon]|nr:fluoride efflux transporter CrcB [Nitrososphaeraceae archaeon]